ncbi:hypothetical protein PHLGIDRAFT_102312, partial [Phlebiopsis gigantea 11061_1 CR5-6]
MAPTEFSVRLQKGITGGFAPPTPSAIFTIDGAPGRPELHITSAVRPHGTPSLQDALPKSLSASDANTQQLVGELYSILKSLPTEQPPGSEDIYRADVGIAFASGDFTWMNGGPRGCGGGTSSVHATPEEKTKFKRAVEIVETLVEKAT